MNKRNFGGITAGLMIALSGLALTGAIVLELKSSLPGATSTTKARQFDPQVTEVFLYRIGITPEALAAAGVTPGEADNVIQSAVSHILTTDRLDRLAQATEASNKAGNPKPFDGRAANPAPIDNPNGVPPAGNPSPEPTPAQKQAALTALLDDSFQFCISTLPAEKQATLRNIRRHHGWELPHEYLAVERSPEQWVALRGALAAKRYAESRGAQVPTAAASVIAQADGVAGVGVARGNLASGLTGVRDTWRGRLTTTPNPSPAPTPSPR